MNIPEIKYRIKYFLGIDEIEIISLEKLNNGSWNYCSE